MIGKSTWYQLGEEGANWEMNEILPILTCQTLLHSRIQPPSLLVYSFVESNNLTFGHSINMSVYSCVMFYSNHESLLCFDVNSDT